MCGSRRDVAEEEDRKKNGGQSEVARRGVENNTMGRWRDDAMPHACIGNFSSFSFLPTRSLMEKKNLNSTILRVLVWGKRELEPDEGSGQQEERIFLLLAARFGHLPRGWRLLPAHGGPRFFFFLSISFFHDSTHLNRSKGGHFVALQMLFISLLLLRPVVCVSLFRKTLNLFLYCI